MVANVDRKEYHLIMKLCLPMIVKQKKIYLLLLQQEKYVCLYCNLTELSTVSDSENNSFSSFKCDYSF